MVFPQPLSGLFVVGNHLLDQRPKSMAVVHFLQVAKLVDDHEIDHLDRRHDQPPAEIEVAGAGTAPPSAFLVAEGNPTIAESVMLVEMVQAVANGFLGLLPIELTD